MGRESRQNQAAQDAKSGRLLSRQSIIGAMDHALEIHASALDKHEQEIRRLTARLDAIDAMHLAESITP